MLNNLVDLVILFTILAKRGYCNAGACVCACVRACVRARARARACMCM